jgi:hypothetical protein
MRPQSHLGIGSMCRLGQVSRAGFYRHWQQKEPRSEETESRSAMRHTVLGHRRNYGHAWRNLFDVTSSCRKPQT